MKFTLAIIFVGVVGTSAFSTRSPTRTTFALRMQEDSEAPVADAPVAESPVAAFVAPTKALPKMSESLPFMARPAALDGTMAGDAGFDPFGFAKSKEDLMNYREAEIKHARLAMLAAAGWPLSELFDRKIANSLGLTPIVDASDRAPSLLNGGLGKISPFYWIACLGFAAAVDLYGINQAKKTDPSYFPGNLGFDPLGLYPSDKAGQDRMQLAEIKNGRLGMIAITAFAVQEAVYSLGVVDETPIFFKPIGGVLREYANSGYIQ